MILSREKYEKYKDTEKPKSKKESVVKESVPKRRGFMSKVKRSGIAVVLIGGAVAGGIGYKEYEVLKEETVIANMKTQVAQDLGNEGIKIVNVNVIPKAGGTYAINAGINVAPPSNPTECVVDLNYHNVAGVASLSLSLSAANGAVINPQIDNINSAGTEAQVSQNLWVDTQAYTLNQVCPK